MKQIFTKSIYATVAAAIMIGFASCDPNNNNPVNNNDEKEQALQAMLTPYVENNVIFTYTKLADATIQLHEACETIFAKYEAGTLQTADVENACNYWNQARKYWELSESFLFGPAGNHNIDPHIDSWPLDKDMMDQMLNNEKTMAYIEEKGSDYIVALGYGLLGFHAVEYMLYELSEDGTESHPHSLTYTRPELVYLVAVAEDLRNQTVCLEACWAGTDNVTAEKQAVLEEAELDYGENYADYFRNAGKVGSIYKTAQEAAEELVQGCIDIADEVGNTKIGTPCFAANDEDRDYIESPYSLNSIEDFTDNIRSIQNSYNGMANDRSLSDYIKSVNPELDAQMQSALDNAIKAIQAIPEPFAKTAGSAEAKNAVKVVGSDLVDVLEAVYAALSEN
ncbi:MAG: hypothetical protein NC038_00080 [Paludibacter sp.]|nr:hypothetical protein [Bacteroidales bacterium]MCM1068764.1 hypothetical protein [Prevotella sp.]MCM1354476.1 hypothetical protein [Bacteroides sp.]MCM1443279.1 hypothetical protein [Muribaculum sp.]MCM1481036.1 hypothetical protein [Paludibacter sp.]